MRGTREESGLDKQSVNLVDVHENHVYRWMNDSDNGVATFPLKHIVIADLSSQNLCEIDSIPEILLCARWKS